jgi:hypothetical protein
MLKAPLPISNGVVSCNNGMVPPKSYWARKGLPLQSKISIIVIIVEAKVGRLHNKFLALNKVTRPTTCNVAILVPDIIAHLSPTFLIQ